MDYFINKWTNRVLFHFIQASVVNAHILYKQVYDLKRGNDLFTLQSFVEELVKQLCYSNEVPTEVDTNLNNYHNTSEKYGNARLTGLHVPGLIKMNRGEINGKYPQDIRRCCIICGLKTNQMCDTCNVACHFKSKEETSKESCWVQHHTKKKKN